jgi:hypothetical protein
MSTALSCWLGFLACVLGCALPMSATVLCERAQVSELDAAARHETAGADACCHHSRNSSGSSKETEHNTVSCCPLDATLLQKQNPAPPRSELYVAILALPIFSSLNQLSAGDALRLPTLSHPGRDVLLQTHVLRI